MEEYKIYKNGKTYDATEEQCNIFRFIQQGYGNAVINAAAGSAKTTTIENAIRYIPTDKKVLFVAFNKDVCEEIKKDISKTSPNATISTFHSLGYSLLLNCLPQNKLEVYEHKYNKYITENIDVLTSYGETTSLGRSRSRYMKNIFRLLEYSRYYCVMKINDIKSLIDIYGDIVLIRDEVDVVRKVLIWGQEHLDTIDYTDMTWLPNVLNLITKKIKYKYIFVDEAQDVTIAEERIIEKVKDRSCRLITVGDEKQRINVWCGASAKAFDNFKNAENTQEFSLSTSFRLPKIGEKLIHDTFPNIKIFAADNAIEGKINYNVSLSMVRPYSMVLCRNTMPLINSMLEVMRMNKKCYLKGWETEQEIFQSIVKNHPSTMLDKNCITQNGLFPQLYKELFDMIQVLEKTHGLSRTDALANDEVFNFLDQILCLEVISEGCFKTEELIDKLNMIFKKTSDSKDAIIFTTVHRAKGLEADNIFILHPFLLDGPFATAAWEIEAEENLKYVALTRFRETLNFVESDIQNRFFLFDKKQIINKINLIFLKISRNDILNYIKYNNSEVPIVNPIITELTLKQESSTHERKKGGLKFGKFIK